MSAYDPTKTYRLKNGAEVLSLHSGANAHTVHGVAKMESGSLRSCVWRKSDLNVVSVAGAPVKCAWHEGFELIEVKPRIKRTVWLVHLPAPKPTWVTDCEADARTMASSTPGAAIERHDVDCEEGEGL